MAATDALMGRAIRCPVCLKEQRTIGSPAPWDKLRCERCQRDFEFRNALPAVESKKTAATIEATAKATPDQTRFWIFGLLIVVWLMWAVYSVQEKMDGPEFLVFYFFVLLFSFFGSYLLHFFADGDAPSYLALLVFEGIGVERIIYGAAHGMHKFWFLIFFMIIGFFLLTVRTEIARNRWDSRGNNSSSCSSIGGSCGGGCGGGGCGGCGG